ncbi:MAG: poly-gamma-glutamate biosynthesis protein PgsC/CapC [Polyangiaceae bacterium]|nr:poly-gamma-glutamate biosynthesis protein PgsC/CapC [Polyangiaceae bacterium]
MRTARRPNGTLERATLGTARSPGILVVVLGADPTLWQLFPANGLDQSLHAPVLVGLLVLTFFRETLGWGYAGLVVPGYLAAVMLAAPLTGGLIVAEAILGYLFAALVGHWMPRTEAWSSVFGRERFLLLIVTALIVRVSMEAYWLEWLLARYHLVHSRELYSIGLVLVPLLANSFWNQGLRIALPRVAIVTLLTYLFVDHVLLGYTNFTLSRFRIANESVSLSFLETPHAHVILLLGAVMAARDNVLYGWDYNGILVPALLAVAWYQPTKLVTTIVEAILVLVLARSVARLWPFSKILMVGSRRMLLTYIVGFVAKWALGLVAMRFTPGLQMVDYFGFGYLLPSLLAVKMWNTDQVGRVLMPTVQVSLTAFIVGNLASYALRFADPAPRRKDPVSVELQTSPALALMLADTAPSPRPEPMTLKRSGSYEEALLLAEAIARAKPPGRKLDVRVSNRLRVTSTPDGWWIVGPRAIDPNDDRVAPRFAMRPRSSSRPWMVVIETSRVGAPETVVGLKVAGLLGARLVLLRSRFTDQREYDDPFRLALVRAHGIAQSVVVTERPGPAALSVVGRVPGNLSVESLKNSLGIPISVAWRAADRDRDSWKDLPRLAVSRPDMERAASSVGHPPPPDLWLGSVARSFRARKRELTHIEAGAYRVPSIEELRLFGETLGASLSSTAFDAPSPWQRTLAAALGYRFAKFATTDSGPASGWALYEPTGPTRRGLPTWLLRRTRQATQDAVLVEVPAPRWEAGSIDSALSMADAFDARGLLVPGALPNVDARGRADPRKVAGRQSYYQRAHEAWLSAGGRVLAINGIAPQTEGTTGAIFTFQEPTDSPLGGPVWTRGLASLLIRMGLSVDSVDGSAEREPYSGEGDPTMAYARRFAPDRMAMLWLAAPVRSWYASLDTLDPTPARLERAARAVGGGSVAGHALELVRCGGAASRGACAGLDQYTRCDAAAVYGALEHYRDTRNPFELRAALEEAHRCRLDFATDEQTGRVWATLVSGHELWLVPLGPGQRPREEPLLVEPADLIEAVHLGLSTLRLRRAS